MVAAPETKERGVWVRWALLVAGVVFLLPAPFNLVAGDFANALAGLALGAIGIGGYAFITKSRRERAAFLTWLKEHAQQVSSGQATYEGHVITPSTRLRAFDTSVSLLFLSAKFTSKYVVEGDPSMAGLKAACTSVSALLGWWGIPFGPIYTVMVLHRNLTGGHVTTAGQLLAGL